MTAELGVLFLVLALIVSLLQSAYLLPFVRLRFFIGKVMTTAAWLQAIAITAAMLVLITLRLDSDFSVENVVAHSNLSLPTLYKIVGTWGNHEGSMLLWVLVLAVFGAMLACGKQSVLSHYAVAIQSILCAGFLAFILDTSNPFSRIFPPAIDGKTLNPLLQDIGLAIHPPLLYFGYVGFSIVFSLAVAALLVGRADRQWANMVHPWIMLAWSSLTIGIGMGSWWAYRELGWGGWWFWDPVENASLLPWLSGTALLHSNIILRKRGILAQWVLLLSIVTFALSLLGTFLVRSGVITSVHSFASDPLRGMFILAYIFITVGGALFLYSLRGGLIKSNGTMLPISREGLIVINNLFILSACATVLLGTLYPIFADLAGVGQITVGAPYFNATFLPLMAIPLVFAALTPFMAWKKASLQAALNATRPAILATLATVFLVLAFTKTTFIIGLCGFALAAWLAVGSLQWLLGAKGKRGKYSVFLGHIGAACMVLGITASGLWKEEVQARMAVGDSISIENYQVEYLGSEPMTGKNYSATRAKLLVLEYGSKPVTTLYPEYRTYDIIGSNTSEKAVYYGILGDIYIAIGETTKDGKTAIRLYFQPMISFIWLGFVFMTIGGMISYLQNKKQRETINVIL